MDASAFFTYLLWSPFVAAAVIVPLEHFTGRSVGELWDRVRWRMDERRARDELRLIADRETVTPADLAYLADHDLEFAWTRPVAPNPRLREVHGDWFIPPERRAQVMRRRQERGL